MKRSPGSCLAMRIRQDGKRTQLVVVGGPIPARVDLASFMAGVGQEDLPTLYTSPWCESEAIAKAVTMPVYFQLYERQEGFKHPEDPSRCAADPVGDATVVTLKESDPDVYRWEARCQGCDETEFVNDVGICAGCALRAAAGSMEGSSR